MKNIWSPYLFALINLFKICKILSNSSNIRLIKPKTNWQKQKESLPGFWLFFFYEEDSVIETSLNKFINYIQYRNWKCHHMHFWHMETLFFFKHKEREFQMHVCVLCFGVYVFVSVGIFSYITSHICVWVTVCVWSSWEYVYVHCVYKWMWEYECKCVFVCVCGVYAGIMYRMLFAFTLILFFKKLVSL